MPDSPQPSRGNNPAPETQRRLERGRAMSSAALAGIRVLDLTRLLPGPLATLVLADLGASVDKIEDPEAGDYARHLPPIVGGQGAAFHALNRGKRSAVLDLARPDGVRAFERLVVHYD